MQSAQGPKGVCYDLKIIPQIWGGIFVEPILSGCPLLLWAHSVLGDAQRMGSHDRALRAIRAMEDEPSNSLEVLLVLYPEGQ